MTDSQTNFALKRPDETLIRKFQLRHLGDRTIRYHLEKRYSLAICCRDCPRLIAWSPPELLERFGARLDLKLRDLVPRLACTGEGGCGSHDIAVFPHLYGGDWTWPPIERHNPDGARVSAGVPATSRA